MPKVVCMADVISKDVRWLWPGHVPLGKLTILDGDPGLGKSLISIDVAARVSKGAPMPDDTISEVGTAGVLMLASEDDLEDTIKPRLVAAEANCVNVHSLTPEFTMGSNGIHMPSLDDLTPGFILQYHTRLIIIDPVVAYMPGDTHVDADVRKVLAKLAYIAQYSQVSILAIRHLNKKPGMTNAIYRGGGSIGFIASARSGMIVVPDSSSEGRYILACTKANLAPPFKPLAYSIECTGTRQKDPVRIHWHGETMVNLETALTQPEEGHQATNDAILFIKDVLAAGPMKTKDVQELAKNAGITTSTLRRAKDALGIQSVKNGFGQDGAWCWQLSNGRLDRRMQLATITAEQAD